MKDINFDIPDNVLEIFKKHFEFIPSETFVGGVKKEGVDILLKKNELVWFKRFTNSNIEIYKEGIVKYGTNNVYIYFNKNEDESIYKLVILSNGIKDDITLKILINGLKSYFTVV